MTELVLKSDVSNDLIQNADQIGSVAKALTEFVWNSVQYQPEGQVPEVAVVIRRGRSGGIEQIYIEDNGRGMDFAELQAFFTMHAENRDRLEGRPGRGRFGTGAKAAAMAVADEVEVDTVKNGQRIVAILQRTALTGGTSEIPIPHNVTIANRPNGTKVTLRRFRIRRFKEEAVRAYVQRAIGRALLTSKVSWNNERMLYTEPAHTMEWNYDPPEEYLPLIGNVKLHVRFSEYWLDAGDRGITISSMEIPHERNFLGDHSSSPYAGRIFGDIEVPLLEDEDEEGRPAYTADRTMMLNRESARVDLLLRWINDVVGDLVKELETEEKAQQDRVRQERLRQTAKTIEDALNRRLLRAFENMERRVNLRSSGTSSISGVDVQHSGVSTTIDVEAGQGDQEEYVRQDDADLKWRDPAKDEKTDITVMEHDPNPVHAGEGRGEADKESNGLRDPEGEKGASTRETNRGTRKKRQPKGSFRVVPKAMGQDAPRAYYSLAYMTIYVNTDHPQIAAAGDESSPEFKILLAECAASEFALALTEMRIEYGDPDVDPAQWQTIITAIRSEASETGVELANAIAGYRNRAS